MNRMNCFSLLFLCLAVAGFGCAATRGTNPAHSSMEKDNLAMEDIRQLIREACKSRLLHEISGEGVDARIAPARGGRLMFFCPSESQTNGSSASESACRMEPNALWTAPPNAIPTAGWDNHGG